MGIDEDGEGGDSWVNFAGTITLEPKDEYKKAHAEAFGPDAMRLTGHFDGAVRTEYPGELGQFHGLSVLEDDVGEHMGLSDYAEREDLELKLKLIVMDKIKDCNFGYEYQAWT